MEWLNVSWFSAHWLDIVWIIWTFGGLLIQWLVSHLALKDLRFARREGDAPDIRDAKEMLIQNSLRLLEHVAMLGVGILRLFLEPHILEMTFDDVNRPVATTALVIFLSTVMSYKAIRDLRLRKTQVREWRAMHKEDRREREVVAAALAQKVDETVGRAETTASETKALIMEAKGEIITAVKDAAHQAVTDAFEKNGK